MLFSPSPAAPSNHSRALHAVVCGLVVAASFAAVSRPAEAYADDESAALQLSQQGLKHYMLERYEQAAVLYRKA